MESITKLPVGLLVEEGTIESKLVKCDTVERVPPAEEEQCSVAAKDTQPKPEQQIEEQEEVQSSDESSDGWVKVEISKEEELKGGEQQDIATECDEETRNEAELPTMESAKRAAELVSGSHREEDNEKKLTHQEEQTENERSLLNKLLDAGNEQLKVISDMTERVKDLEKRLARSKKRMRTRGSNQHHHCARLVQRIIKKQSDKVVSG
ncbi:hypothetical protein S83_037572 [Arachis hypogaea]